MSNPRFRITQSQFIADNKRHNLEEIHTTIGDQSIHISSSENGELELHTPEGNILAWF